jgi:hypothetical protein
MPKVHRRTFVFLITFMKHLLKYSEANGLDSKVLGEYLSISALRIYFQKRLKTQDWAKLMSSSKIQEGGG